MRKLLRAIFAALGRVVIRSVRLASGAVVMVMEMLRPATPAVDYDDAAVGDAAELDHAASGRNAEIESYEMMGRLVLQAAAERVRHGQVVSTTIPLPIKNYVNCLPREALAVVLASDALGVGRHVAGVQTLRLASGAVVATPNAKRDAAAVARDRAEVERRENAYRLPAASRQSASVSAQSSSGAAVANGPRG